MPWPSIPRRHTGRWSQEDFLHTSSMREKKIAPVKFPKRQEALTERSDSGLFIWKSKTDKTTLVHRRSGNERFSSSTIHGKKHTARVEFPNLQETQTERSDPAGYYDGSRPGRSSVSNFHVPRSKKRNHKRESKHNPESLPKMEHRRNISNSIWCHEQTQLRVQQAWNHFEFWTKANCTLCSNCF